MNVNKGQFLQNLTLKICNSLEFENTLLNCFGYLKKNIPADGITFDITIPDGPLVSIARVTAKGVDVHDIPVPLSPEARKEGKEIEEEVLLYNAPDLNPTSKDWTRHFGIEEASYLVINLISGSRWRGWLGIYAFGINRYTDEHAKFLSRVKAPLAIAMSNALKYWKIKKFTKDIAKENQELYQELMEASGRRIVGAESGLKRVMELAKKVSATDSPIILLGETGVGKDMIANAIHLFSDRKAGPIIKVNCGAIPKDLIDSESTKATLPPESIFICWFSLSDVPNISSESFTDPTLCFSIPTSRAELRSPVLLVLILNKIPAFLSILTCFYMLRKSLLVFIF